MHLTQRIVLSALSILVTATAAGGQIPVHALITATAAQAPNQAALQPQTAPAAVTESASHNSEEWALIAPHLPDPLHASPERLEMAGDVLRARKFPEDALTFYQAAVNRGGVTNRLLKKEGVVHLELQHGLMAHLCFKQAVKFNKRDSEAWNNLGAADFMLGNAFSAVSEYKHAVKLNRESAIFRSNLSLAYFEVHDGRGARRELARAFALDPEVLHHSDTGGYNLQVLGSAHYAEICFEMARVYAAQGDRSSAINWLTKAAERGFDVRAAMQGDALLRPYLDDDRVRTMLRNGAGVSGKQVTARVKLPGLGTAPQR